MIYRSKAPLRVCFGGDGTDVSPYSEKNGGAVLSTSIDKYVYSTLRPSYSKTIEIESLDYEIVAKYATDKDLIYNGELDLVKAAIKRMNAEQDMLKIFIHSDAPPGSGLGSSSTTAVSVVGLLKEFKGIPMTNYELAELAYKIEREDIGIKGGKQDQYVAAFGGFNYIEFINNTVIVNPLKINLDVLNELHYNLLLCYTGKTRLFAKIIDDQIARYEKNIKILDFIKALAYDMKNALLKGDLSDFGEMLHKSWQYKKCLASGITDDYINKLYDTAIKSGALGGKLLGAGGGGYLLFYCKFDKKHIVAEALEKLGAQVIEFDFDFNGLQTWQVPE